MDKKRQTFKLETLLIFIKKLLLDQLCLIIYLKCTTEMNSLNIDVSSSPHIYTETNNSSKSTFWRLIFWWLLAERTKMFASSSRRILESGHLFGHCVLLTRNVKVEQFCETIYIYISLRIWLDYHSHFLMRRISLSLKMSTTPISIELCHWRKLIPKLIKLKLFTRFSTLWVLQPTFFLIVIIPLAYQTLHYVCLGFRHNIVAQNRVNNSSLKL